MCHFGICAPDDLGVRARDDEIAMLKKEPCLVAAGHSWFLQPSHIIAIQEGCTPERHHTSFQVSPPDHFAVFCLLQVVVFLAWADLSGVNSRLRCRFKASNLHGNLSKHRLTCACCAFFSWQRYRFRPGDRVWHT